ncbi:MAG TPA: hypothetical protein VNJ12_07285, partial [Candidatus Dormibacteraeota bacterium]|nr:hypothetical protein [Candidatus Dormibacteraeota bacterium]
ALPVSSDSTSEIDQALPRTQMQPLRLSCDIADQAADNNPAWFHDQNTTLPRRLKLRTGPSTGTGAKDSR